MRAARYGYRIVPPSNGVPRRGGPSAIVTQSVTARSNAVEAARTELLAGLADDVGDNGVSDWDELSGQLKAGAQDLGSRRVLDQVDALFEARDVRSVRPTLERSVDIDGDGLTAGHDDSDGGGLVDTEHPDPYMREAAWVDGEPTWTGRLRPAACILGDKRFALRRLDPPTSAEGTAPLGAEWTPLAECLVDMSFSNCALLGDLVYVFGRTGTFSYNPATNAYDARATMRSRHDRFAAVAVGGVACIIGGDKVVRLNEDTTAAEYSDEVRAYAPSTRQWSSRAACQPSTLRPPHGCTAGHNRVLGEEEGLRRRESRITFQPINSRQLAA